MFSDATAVFDGILDDTNILNRADAVSKYYDDFMDYSAWYRVLGRGKHTITSEVDGETTVKTFDLNERNSSVVYCFALHPLTS